MIGPGLLLGLVAASTWGLVFLVSDRLRNSGVDFDGGWWVELSAHLVFLLAAGLAGLALARTGEVRVLRRPPQGELAWLVVILGCAGALALIFHDLKLWQIWQTSDQGQPDRWYVAPSVWMTVMAAVVPACAAMSVPRRFAVALLAGWIAGGAAFFGFQYIWDRYQYGGPIGTDSIIMFWAHAAGALGRNCPLRPHHAALPGRAHNTGLIAGSGA